MDGVEEIIPIMLPYKLAGKELYKEASVIDVDGVKIEESSLL